MTGPEMCRMQRPSREHRWKAYVKQNEDGRHRSLREKTRAPQFLVQPLSTFQKYGGSVTLTCVVDPPNAAISWRLNGVQLGDVPGVLVSGGTLIIASLNNDTAGRYQCIAQTPSGAMASVPAIVALASKYLFY
ncbi:brother of CDO-like [Rana temporaria]|uniref:brother of CDO-like n=1 Tax=Rana temporaria TaxID=8407 RepID=UPI001AACC596|nr:brother of CDO-like [Rana temporaria]